MKVYITKYALTKGIFAADAEICESINQGMVKLNEKYEPTYFGNDWHKTKKEAIARAEIMREKKLKSLRKQIAKIEWIDFNEQVEGA